MKKLSFILIAVLLSFTVAKAQLFCSYKKNIQYPYPSFYTVKKYPNLYINDAEKIHHLQKQLKKYKKKYKCYKKFDERYNHYNRLTQIGLKKYEKKKTRALHKALKYGQKFVDFCLINYLDLDSLYMAKIIYLQSKQKLPDSLTYLADSLKLHLNEYNFKISDAKSKAISEKGIKRIELFMEACLLNKQRLDLKEEYISLLMRDPIIIKKLAKRYPKPKPSDEIKEKTEQEKDTTEQNTTQPSYNQALQPQNSKYYIPRIDELSSYLKLTTSERVKIDKYKQLLAQIQNTEALFITTIVKDTLGLMDSLGNLYWQAYHQLYEIYYPHLNQNENRQVQKYYSIAKKIYDQYTKTKDITYLWESIHYIIPAIITAENILATKYQLGGQYKITDILPADTTKEHGKKVTTGKKTQTKKQTKTPSKINCTPSGAIYTYDIENPKPRILRETGTYYRIYVGTSSRKVLPKEFSNYQPITYLKICKEPQNKAKRYYVGRYTDKQKALADARRLRKEFALPTKVVTFVNGHPKGAMRSNYTQEPALPCSIIPNINTTKYLIYAIRLGTYTLPKQKNELKYLHKLYYQTTTDGKYTYYDAPYYSYSQAIKGLKQLKAMGYSDAYIVAFNNGQKISISNARKLESNIKSSTNIIFGVQVGAFSKPLSQEKYRQIYGKLRTYYQVSMIEKGQLYVYYVYAGTTYNSAQDLKNKIRQLGYKDAFVIAIKNNQVIPLSEAIK